MLCATICGILFLFLNSGSSATKEQELFFAKDPSVINPERPPVLDNRTGAFAMSAREALDEIEEVHSGKVDCKRMLETRGLKILRLKYKDSAYTEQANVAIRTSNLVADLLPTGSIGKMNASHAGKVLQDHEELLFSIVRNNLESDPLIVGSALIFDNYTYRSGYRYFAPYAYKNVGDPFIKVKDLSTSWSYLHVAFVKMMKSKAVDRPFPTRTTYFSPRFNQTTDLPRFAVTHTFAEALDGLWTRPYYECTTSRSWIVTFTVPVMGSWDKDAKPAFM